MPTVVGVRLRFSKTLWFDPAGTVPVEGDTVIVETERGTEVGTVVQAPHEVADADLPAPLKPISRIADEEDLAYVEELLAKEREAMPIFRELVLEHKLDMKPVDVEYLFSGDKVVFYFSAEERIDFRELVRDLAAHFRARIDMRQVGVRDEARMVGGIGHCGQMLCCVRFGGEFQPVSIRMAKEQDLPLNPLKISGLCGRLMCCLRYEFDAYKDYKSRAPKRGAIIDTAAGLAKVVDLDTPRETVTMRFEDGNRATVPLARMECAKGTGCPCSVGREALEEAGAITPVAVVEEPEPLTPRKRSEKPPAPKPERRKQPQGGGGEQEQAAEQPTRSGRRRRRRGGGKSGDEQAAPKPQRQPKAQQAKAQQAKAQQAPKAQPAPAESSGGAQEGQPAKSTRRRRRRRSGSGGGGTSSEGS